MEVDRIKNLCSKTLVLSLLKDGPMHGYQMCKEIESRTEGYFTLKHSTLYPTLHRLEKDGLVAGTWKTTPKIKPRKYYRLTRKGAAHHRQTTNHWRQFFTTMALLVPEVAG
ncbi:PadR family transcriptional regulator [Myxococcota bacterium]